VKRIVYNPKVNVWVKSDYGIVDLSPLVVTCQVDRKMNQVSNATVTFRNPNKVFTDHHYFDPITKKNVIGPMFHPMDPITIFMTRLESREIQVFTGYCDTTPYLQLFPGPVTIEASCTLKRLQYTYWDPGLPFVWEFLANHGWQISTQFGEGIVNANAEAARAGKDFGENAFRTDDSGIGKLLYAVLNEVGNWDDSTIYIEHLPKEIVPLVANMFDQFKIDGEQANHDFIAMLHKIIGSGSVGGGGGPGAPSATSGNGAAVPIAASFYDLPGAGSCGTLQQNYSHAYAELGYGGGVGNSMGDLPCGYEITVSYNGKSRKIMKCDIGSGGAGVDGKPRGIDLSGDVARYLGMAGAGVAVLQVEGLPPGTIVRGQGGETVTVPDGRGKNSPGAHDPGHNG
jgi:hypothetical protein